MGVSDWLNWLGRLPPAVEKGAKLRSYSRRGRTVDQVLLHESVSFTRERCIKSLKGQGYGVHYIVDRDGSVTGHVPVKRATTHAGGHNYRGIGVEFVNRYYGKHAKPGHDDVISAVWAHNGRYIYPTDSQLASGWRLVRWLCDEHDIPFNFPGTQGLEFKWGRIGETADDVPGIQAHQRSHHADGLVEEHYCFCRARGFSHERALELTREAATSGERRTSIPAPTEVEAA